MIHTLEMLVNPFKDLNSGSPDRIEKISSEKDELVEKALSYYHPTGEWKQSSVEALTYSKIHGIEFDALSPAQIDLVLNEIIASTSHVILNESLYAGFFMSRLMKKSQEAGNKKFVLHTGDSQISSLCRELNGADVVVYGNVGNSFARDAEKCNFKVSGNAGLSFASNSRECNYWLNGESNMNLGIGARTCNFVLDKKPALPCGRGSKDCTYHFTDVNVYLDMIVNIGGKNKVEYLEE